MSSPDPLSSLRLHRHSVPAVSQLDPSQPAKCTCRGVTINAVRPPIEKSILERRQNILLDERKTKMMRHRREKRDAATSPQMTSRKESNPIPARSPCSSVLPVQSSPRREVPMRNAATSPARCVRDPSSPPPSEDPIPKDSPNTPKVMLEKSKSVSDNRPTRQLRNTRSLSPRPPIQHQQAIVVSNENDFVLHVTPIDNDDDEVFTSGSTPAPTVTSASNCNSLQLRGKQRGKAHSEHTSPNLSGGSFLTHDTRFANNRSTGCLVYVPSDPWIQLPTSANPSKSHNLISLDNDPWIQRRSADKSRKSSRPSLNNSNCHSNDKINHAPSPRPKPLRTKTPAATQLDNSSCCDLTTIRSPLKLPPPPPAPTVHLESRSRAQHFLLNVANNPAHQPRHSFSTLLPPKDDELQLNIRRLSEQVKTTANAPHHPSVDFSSYLLEQRRIGSPNPPAADVMSAMTVAKQAAAFCGAAEVESVLETTC